MHENHHYPNPWLSTSLLVLFCLSLTSVQLMGDDSRNSAVPWLNLIDDGIRELVHATTKEVPPYPLRGKKWIDVKNWPGELTLDGERYTLRLEVQRYDDVFGIPFSEKRDGDRWSASYTRPAVPPERGSSRSAGPAYYWSPDGSLSERSYMWVEGVHRSRTYCYDANGSLYQYSCWETGDRTISEFFNANGRLVGFIVDLRNRGSLKSKVAYWDGEKVDSSVLLREYLPRLLENRMGRDSSVE